MYNVGTPSTIVGGGGLAVTGVSALQVIGFAMIAIGLIIGGLLMLRTARLRRPDTTA